MRNVIWSAMALATFASVSVAENIRGEYIEARNANNWTGPCFANGEIGIVGDKAIVAFKVTEGTHKRARLDGLAVAAVVMGDKTFGVNEKVNTRAVLIVDERANAEQTAALVDLAQSLAPETIQQVLTIRKAPIHFETNLCTGGGCSELKAAEALIESRCLCSKDSVCGHEDLFYPPLASVENKQAAFAIRNEYKGREFGETFEDNNGRSVVLATFSL